MKVAFYIWAGFQSLFFAATILYNKRSKANVLLSVFFILTSLIIFLYYLLRFNGFLKSYPEIGFLCDTINFSFGPVAFFYLSQVLFGKLPKYWWLHLVVPLGYAIYFFTNHIVINAPFVFAPFSVSIEHKIILFCVAVSFTFYGLFYQKTLSNYHKNSNNHRSDVQNWLYIFLAFFLMKAFGAYFVAFKKIFLTHIVPYDQIANSIFEVLFIIIDGIIVLVAGLLSFSSNKIVDLDNIEDPFSKKKKLQVTSEDSERVIELLHKKVTVEKIFKNPEINEKQLADAIKVQPYMLSMILNQNLGKTFNEFINEHRIEEAKILLTSPSTSNYTIYAIALECGYNSESVFYSNFKRIVGTTPKKFQMAALDLG
jgi:AraC-like DNA-binding protein